MDRNASCFFFVWFLSFVRCLFFRHSLTSRRARYSHITAHPTVRWLSTRTYVCVRVYQNAFAISNEISNNVSNVVFHAQSKTKQKNGKARSNALLSCSLTLNCTMQNVCVWCVLGFMSMCMYMCLLFLLLASSTHINIWIFTRMHLQDDER